MIIKILFISLILISILELIFIGLNKQKNRYMTKPLLMPLIMALYMLYSHSINYAILGALFFCFLGDVFLLISKGNDNFFKLGLVSFLKGHVLYIYALMPPIAPISLWCISYIVPYIILFMILYDKLRSNFGAMKIPVVAYLVVILFMSFTSLIRMSYVGVGYQFWFPFIGSIVFIVSDFILAYSMFVRRIKDDGLWVMFTYIVAQIFIVGGFC